MKYAIVVLDLNTTEDYQPTVYGPYENKGFAMERASIFPEETFSVDVVPLHSLSEELDNPYGHYMTGDAPEGQ